MGLSAFPPCGGALRPLGEDLTEVSNETGMCGTALIQEQKPSAAAAETDAPRLDASAIQLPCHRAARSRTLAVLPGTTPPGHAGLCMLIAPIEWREAPLLRRATTWSDRVAAAPGAGTDCGGAKGVGHVR